jgi:hypothetical protein
VPSNIGNQLGRRQHRIEPQSVKFHAFLLPVKEMTHNASSAFKQAYPVRASSVPSQEIIGGSSESEANDPSGILLPNLRFHGGVAPGQFVYEPIRQVTPISTATYEMFFRCGRVECSASEGDDHARGYAFPLSRQS